MLKIHVHEIRKNFSLFAMNTLQHTIVNPNKTGKAWEWGTHILKAIVKRSSISWLITILVSPSCCRRDWLPSWRQPLEATTRWAGSSSQRYVHIDTRYMHTHYYHPQLWYCSSRVVLNHVQSTKKHWLIQVGTKLGVFLVASVHLPSANSTMNGTAIVTPQSLM